MKDGKNDSPALIVLLGVVEIAGEEKTGTSSKSASAAYRENWESIFGRKETEENKTLN